MFSPDGTLISASAAPHCGGTEAHSGRTERLPEGMRGLELSVESGLYFIDNILSLTDTTVLPNTYPLSHTGRETSVLSGLISVCYLVLNRMKKTIFFFFFFFFFFVTPTKLLVRDFFCGSCKTWTSRDTSNVNFAWHIQCHDGWCANAAGFSTFLRFPKTPEQRDHYFGLKRWFKIDIKLLKISKCGRLESTWLISNY